MCKAMASEGIGSIAGGGGGFGKRDEGDEEQQQPRPPPVTLPPPSAAADQQTAGAAAQLPQQGSSPSVQQQPFGGQQQQPQLQQQQPSDYLLAMSGMSVAGPPACMAGAPPPSSSQQGSDPGGISATASWSVTTGLQEAMQQLNLTAVTSAQQAAAFGDPSLIQQGSGEQQQQQADGPATLFFAKVPRTATKEQIQALFASFGEVDSVNLFAPYEGAPTSKGCGLVIMRSYGDAAAVIAGLEHYKWEGMHSAMVVKLMAPQRQRQDQALGLETAASGASSGGLRSPSHASSSRLVPSASPASRGASSYASPGQMRMVVGGMDMAPPGCAPDAYKLFVGNIPRAYTEPDLLPIFESIGPVKELVVLRDRATQESKGSAFVWYATGADADKAQATFNLQLVLQQRSGAHSRPLVVRRAVPGRQGQFAGASVGAIPSYPQGQAQQAYAAAMRQGSILSPGYVPMPVSAAQGSYSYATAGSLPTTTGMPGAPLYTMQPAAYVQQQQQAGQQLWQPQQQPSVVHCQGMPTAQYGTPVLLSVAEGPGAGYQPVVQLQQQGSWSGQQQQPPQQPSFVPTGSYDLAQMQAAGGIPVSAPLAAYGGAVEYVQQQPQQAQQPQQPALVMSSVQQAVPTCQQMSLAGPGAGAGLAGSSIPSPGNVLLGGSGPSSTSSNAGLMAVSYQQLGAQHHSITIPLSGDQLNIINSHLGKVAAMSGASITAEHNFACGSLALNVVAASQEQLTVAWQYIHSLLSQPGGATAQVAEGMM